MIPWAAAEQATNRLQFIITDIVGRLANIAGISYPRRRDHSAGRGWQL